MENDENKPKYTPKNVPSPSNRVAPIIGSTPPQNTSQSDTGSIVVTLDDLDMTVKPETPEESLAKAKQQAAQNRQQTGRSAAPKVAEKSISGIKPIVPIAPAKPIKPIAPIATKIGPAVISAIAEDPFAQDGHMPAAAPASSSDELARVTADGEEVEANVIAEPGLPVDEGSETWSLLDSRVWLTIDLNSIFYNYKTIESAVAPLKVMPVLKANAYGLGVPHIAKTLRAAGADCFGVAELREALQLKDLGAQIIVLGGILPSEVTTLVRHGITAPVSDFEMAHRLNQAAQAQGKRARVHCLVDTGMGRLGVPLSQARKLISDISKLPHVEIGGVYSHFPAAYDDRDFSAQQVSDLLVLRETLLDDGIRPQRWHIANSDGINNVVDSCHEPFTDVRTGINLYGIYDSAGKQHLTLKPTLDLKTRLIAIRTLPAGSTVGYGREWELEEDTRIGTISAGYADGLPLQLSDGGEVIICGKRCPVIGRVSMDYTTVCLDDVLSARVGDTVTCLGEGITVSDWAKLKGTHEYDIICSFGNRVVRKYRTL